MSVLSNTATCQCGRRITRKSANAMWRHEGGVARCFPKRGTGPWEQMATPKPYTPPVEEPVDDEPHEFNDGGRGYCTWCTLGAEEH